MGKFKVGDRVREKAGGDLDLIGHWNEYWRNTAEYTGAFYVTGTISRASGRDCVTYSAIPGGAGPLIDTKHLEPAPKFAVGDRVRVLINDTCGDYNKGDVVSVIDVDEGGVSFYDDDDDKRYLTFDRVEPVAVAPQQLTITAGRYYRTRDGRKVGPMRVERGGDVWKWNVASPQYIYGMRPAWREDGGFEYSGSSHPADLISEWVDEPIVAAVEPKFKVGDRVKYKNNTPSYGANYTDDALTIKKVGGGDFNDDVELSYPFSDRYTQIARLVDLELITSRPAIVALIENGQPKPATLPFVHADREAATKEARRLAGKHKGQEFGVYELVSSEKQAKVYEHEWQRLAASGQKDAAIKEVRTATGFTLKGAKDAVEHWLELNAA